jgi:hypothetical protein
MPKDGHDASLCHFRCSEYDPHPSVMDSFVADGAFLFPPSDEGCRKFRASLGGCSERRGSAFREQRMEGRCHISTVEELVEN